MKKQELTQELLKELLFYDPDTGVFTWRERPLSMFKSEMYHKAWNSNNANKEAGNRLIRIFEGRYNAHHIVWFYVYGKWPRKSELIYKNGIKTDNRICNIVKKDKINNKLILNKETLTQELLKSMLFYNPDDGVFTWCERDVKWFKTQRDCNAWNTRYSNKEAGSLNKKRMYITIHIFKKRYSCHHLAYFYMTGKWPKEDIDCIDGDYTNVRFNNIRECSRSDTRYKTIKPIGNNELIGAHFHKKTGKYTSAIKSNGKVTILGLFNTQEEAHQAYVEAKRQISPEFCML